MMLVLRRIFRKPPWTIYSGDTESAVFQLFSSEGLYYWVRADEDLQNEDVPILELDEALLEKVDTPDLPINPKGRYCFLAKEEHFE